MVFSLHKFILVPMDEEQLWSTEIMLQIQGLSVVVADLIFRITMLAFLEFSVILNTNA